MIKEILIALFGIGFCFCISLIYLFAGYVDLFIIAICGIIFGIIFSIWIGHQQIQQNIQEIGR